MDHGGTVLQYVGDEVFAVFGAPLGQPDHAQRAYEAAGDLLATEQELHDRLRRVGLPAVRFGIGVHSGEVVAAHVSDGTRHQYTVIGDTVNVGARLCSNAMAGEAVISAATAASIGCDRRFLIPFELKGRGELHAVRVDRKGPIDARQRSRADAPFQG